MKNTGKACSLAPVFSVHFPAFPAAALLRHVLPYKNVLSFPNNICLSVKDHFSLTDWRAHRKEAETILKTMRGWDVTTFGHNDFKRMGAVLFTLRNGLQDGSCGCPYAEKLILMKEGQILPNHYHLQKTEDIINRAGGVLLIRVWNSLPDGSVDRSGDVRILTDGLEHRVPAGSVVEISRGNSMTVYPGLYHLFTPKSGCGDLIIGEISSINDDRTDNYFEEARPRFIPVEEDCEILFPLCNEYEHLL